MSAVLRVPIKVRIDLLRQVTCIFCNPTLPNGYTSRVSVRYWSSTTAGNTSTSASDSKNYTLI